MVALGDWLGGGVMGQSREWCGWGELPDRDLVQVTKDSEAAAVEAILTDRRFHFEVVGVDAARDRAAVERFGL